VWSSKCAVLIQLNFCRFHQFWWTSYSLKYFHWLMSNCLTGKHFVLAILSSHMYSFSKIVSFKTRLLLRRECCSFSNGEYVGAGLAELKHWSESATREVNNLPFRWVPPNAIGLYVSYFTVCWFSLGGIEAYQTGCWFSGTFLYNITLYSYSQMNVW
jgi:hypothetical protein